MLKSQIVHGSQPYPTLFWPPHQPFAINSININVSTRLLQSSIKYKNIRNFKRTDLTVKATSTVSSGHLTDADTAGTREVKAVLSVLPAATKIFQQVATRIQDDFSDLVGKSLLLELLSSEVDPGKTLTDDKFLF